MMMLSVISSFQPTLPLRGATTRGLSSRLSSMPFQPTLPLRGATADCRMLTSVKVNKFQPTLPLRGATVDQLHVVALAREFQPTLPLRGATVRRRRAARGRPVSTHAPLAGSDTPFLTRDYT